MKKINKFWLALALAVSLFAGRTLLTNQHFYTHDDIQVFRLSEYIKCWQDGQIPCRWSADLGKGYGYPLFIFYPPLIYLGSAIIHQLGFSLIASLNLFSFLLFPLAAYAMFKLTYVLTNNSKLSFLASVIYTMYPYHAVNAFVRGVYAENLAWSLLPLVLAGFTEIAKGKKTYTPGVFLALIILSHNISTMLFYPFTILWTLAVIFDQKTKNKKPLFATSLINLLLPLGLTAFFLLPALFEKQFVQTETMTQGYFQYIVHFVSLSQLFLSNFWGYGSSTFGVDYDGMSFSLGKPLWILFTLASAFLFSPLFKKKKLRKPSYLQILLFFSTLLFISLTHARSTFIWQAISPLKYIQFPWRFIGIVGLTMTVFVTLFLKKTRPSVILILASVFIFSSLSFFKPNQFDTYTDEDFLTGELLPKQQTEGVFDYLPKSVAVVPDYAKNIIFSEDWSLNPEVSSLEKSSNHISFTINLTQAQKLPLSVFNYPGWTASIDKNPVSHASDPVFGLITIDIPAGTHRVDLNFTDTPLRRYSLYISLLSLIIYYYLSKSNRPNT